jgi:hypothetical protein
VETLVVDHPDAGCNHARPEQHVVGIVVFRATTANVKHGFYRHP